MDHSGSHFCMAHRSGKFSQACMITQRKNKERRSLPGSRTAVPLFASVFRASSGSLRLGDGKQVVVKEMARSIWGDVGRKSRCRRGLGNGKAKAATSLGRERSFALFLWFSLLQFIVFLLSSSASIYRVRERPNESFQGLKAGGHVAGARSLLTGRGEDQCAISQLLQEEDGCPGCCLSRFPFLLPSLCSFHYFRVCICIQGRLSFSDAEAYIYIYTFMHICLLPAPTCACIYIKNAQPHFLARFF